MAWKNSFYRRFGFSDSESLSRFDSFPLNEQCFIRKEHKCGKIFGASKSCFIACPKNDELEVILGLMSEKLTKVGIEPIIAVKERVYGQDIFCTKICGKIIESHFCVVILDDNVVDSINIPNPNVYYEYGLMTSIKKHIIPLQKEGLDLAFNIQSYDTIKYKNENIGSELDRAIKDAIRITEKKEKEDKGIALSEKTLLHKLEMAGFDEKRDDSNWFLYDVIEDTNFKGFGQYDKRFYLYLGKIDNTTEFKDYLDDLGVVLYRTEKMAGKLKKKLSVLMNSLKVSKIEMEKEVMLSRYDHQKIEQLELEIKDIKDKISLMLTIFVGFIINPQLSTVEFRSKAEELIHQYDRYKLSLNSENLISFDDISVALSVSST
jgi:hypothetical protein